MIRNYLDLLLDLPWVTEEKKNIDIVQARRVLDNHHNGLEKVKERIVQHLAVMKLRQEKQGSILLFAGPPGTGKTSLGKSIAEALGRKYVRVSLGGVRDEAEIRSSGRPMSAHSPGGSSRESIKPAQRTRSLFSMRSIKYHRPMRETRQAHFSKSLTRNRTVHFSDHYLEVPYDLSDVLFIATANSLATIPAPLLDRMEMIEISGYTKNEKFAIAKDHLIPEVLKEHGLDADKLRFEDESLKIIIEKYTREARRPVAQEAARKNCTARV